MIIYTTTSTSSRPINGSHGRKVYSHSRL